MNEFSLIRDEAGRLVYTDAAGRRHAGVVPVRAFPISAPQEGLSLLGEDGHELLWIERLDDIPPAARVLLEQDLALREFMPEITHIASVSSFATPSKWRVATHRGNAELLLKTEDHIRRLPGNALLIADGHGVSFLIRDIDGLDRHSHRLLERFL